MRKNFQLVKNPGLEMQVAATALLCEKATRKNPQIFPGY